MKKRFKFLLFITAIAAAGMLLFQCYWVYNTYKTGEQNFNKLLTAILQHSIDRYQIQRIKLPATLSEKSPHLDVMEWKTYLPGKKGERSNRGAILKFNQMSVNPADVVRVKLMLAQVLSAEDDKRVNLDSLRLLFKDELRKSGLRQSFKLSLLKHQDQLPENKIASFVNFSKQSQILQAEMNNIGGLLLLQNFLPATVSLALILLSGGSLLYMWVIINGQIKLDRLKNDFISNVTHELRTPLSILKTTHEILLNFGEVHDQEKTVRYLQTNKGILEKLDKNVDRILDITQFENKIRLAKTETLDINKLIIEIIARFTLAGNIDISFLSTGSLKEVITDGYIIDSVISNLVDNTLKYAGEKARIIIKAEPRADGWQLIFGDNGKGIAKEHLPFIFDKFYRVPSGDLHDVKGYGLGLSYVKQLVTSLGGQIEVRSKTNEGTEFTIRFPTP